MNDTQRVQPIPGERSGIIVKAAYQMAQLYVKLFGPYFRTTVLADMVVQAGVEEAEQRCRREEPDNKPTLSKLIMMTGVAFGRVKEILQQPKQIGDQHICAEAAVLANWSKTQRDLETGKPLDLPIFGYSDSFQGIVARLGGRGVSAQTMLERLVSAGNIEVVNKHFVRLIDPNWRFIQDNEDEVLDYGVQSVASLVETIENNLKYRNEPEQKCVERRVYSHCIDEEIYEQSKNEFNALLCKQQEEFSKLIRSKEGQSRNPKGRVLGVGYYLWSSQD